VSEKTICEECGSPIRFAEGVSLGDPAQGYRLLCFKCFNGYVSKRVGLDFEHPDFLGEPRRANGARDDRRFSRREVGAGSEAQKTGIEHYLRAECHRGLVQNPLPRPSPHRAMDRRAESPFTGWAIRVFPREPGVLREIPSFLSPPRAANPGGMGAVREPFGCGSHEEEWLYS